MPRDEQELEIEALQSIYNTDINVLATEPLLTFELSLNAPNDQKVSLNFVFPIDYPEKAEVSVTVNSPAFVDELTEAALSCAKENIGTPCVFTIATTVLEKFEELNKKIVERETEARIARLREEEEMEFKKYQGTRVTPESFAEWRKNFLAEKAAASNMNNTVTINPSRLTGRQMFEKDSSLFESDLEFENPAYMEQTGETENVLIDETLFQDLDGLETEDICFYE